MHHHNFFRFAVPSAAAACAAAALILSAGASAPHAAASSGAIAIDFRAVNDDGKPVTDLKPADVALKVNGKAREIKSLQLVQFEGARGATAGPALPAGFATNTWASAGRDILLVIDDGSIQAGTEGDVKDAARQIMSGLSPADRVGFAAVSATGINMPPTTQRDSVAGVLSSLAGQLKPNESSNDAICRTSITLGALKTIFEGSPNGSATTVVFFSAGMMPPTGGTTALLGKRTQQGADQCSVTTTDYTAVANAAIASGDQLYVAYLTGGTGGAVSTSKSSTGNEQSTGVKSIAGQAGGQLIQLSGSNIASLGQLGRNTSAFYVATYEPDAAERNGAASHVDLHVARDGVKVKSRSEIIVPKGEKSLVDLIHTGVVVRDLPLRAVAYASRNGANDKAKVMPIVEPVEPGVKLASLVVGLIDEKNTLKAQETAVAKELASSPVLLAQMPVPAGKYRMRVAATDTGGRTGTVEYVVDATPAAAPPMKFSNLVLGTQPGLQPLVQFNADHQSAIGYLELYDVPKNMNVEVRLELAQSSEGQPMATSPADVTPTKADDMKIAAGGFVISSLAPGDYLMRAIVIADGKTIGSAAHTLHKAP